MMILSLTITVAADATLTSSVGVSGLEVQSAKGDKWGGTVVDWDGSTAKLTWSGSTGGAGDCDSPYAPQSGRVVLTNKSGSTQVLSFIYTLSLGSGYIRIDGMNVTSSSSFKKVLANNASVTIMISTNNNDNGNTSATISDIKLEVPAANETTTFKPAASGGSYTVDETAVAADTALSNPATKSYALKATPDKNYVFKGWFLNDNLYYTGETLTAAFPDGGTIKAEFEEDPLYKAAKSIDAVYSKDELVEINSRYIHIANNTAVEASASKTNCFYSVASFKHTQDSYDVQYIPFLSWTVSGTTITATKSGTAVGQYYPGGDKKGANNWVYANMAANVIQIKAIQNCRIKFSYTQKVGLTNSSQKDDNPYLRIYQSDSPNVNITTIVNGTTDTADMITSTSGSVDRPLAAGKYLYIYMHGYNVDSVYCTGAGGASSKDYSYTGTIKDFTVEFNEIKYVQTTVFQDNTGKPLAGGKMTVSGTSYTADANGAVTGIELPDGQPMKLAVTAFPKNYKLLGWLVDGTMYYTPTYEYTLKKDTTAHPVFVPASVTFNVSTGKYTYLNTAGQSVDVTNEYIARDTAATNYYTNLEDAFAANNEVVLLGSMIINGDYEIPAGKTLMVPRAMSGAPAWDSSKGWYTPTIGSGGRSVYATLTINNNLTVNGRLVVDGGQAKGNGSVAGPYGAMDVKGTVTVNSGGGLYAYGVVKGPGTTDAQTNQKIEGTGVIHAESGAAVHELLEIIDLRHPVTLSNIVSEASKYGIFPFNSIYIYSIEGEVVFNSGATLYGHHCSSYTDQGAFTIIGGTDAKAMFKINKGTVTKSFVDGRMLIRIDEGADVQTGAMEEEMKGSLFGVSDTIEVNSADYLLPLSSGYHIQVAGGFSIDHNFKMLPGAVLDVLDTGVLTIGANGNMVLYRLNDYDYRKQSDMSDPTIPTGFTSTGYPINFSRYSPFTIANVGSAQLNVDGQVIVNGGLYVTDLLIEEGSEKYTRYDNGYNFLTGIGTIDMTNAKNGLTQIHETLHDSETRTIHDYPVTVVPIKGLVYNAAGTTGEELAAQYVSLVNNPDADQDLYYGMINANGLNVWDRNPCACGHTFIYDGAAPTYTWAEDNTSVTAEVTCKYCDEVLTEITEKITVDTVTEADCKTEGTSIYTATFENAAFTEQTKNVVIPIKPHTPGDPADCDSDQICTVCKDVLEAAKGHTKGEDVVTIAATCTEKGSVSDTCTTCLTLIVEELPTLGGYHLWVNGKCDKPNCNAQFLFDGANIAVNEGLDMYFYVNAADVADTDTAFYAVVTKVFADGRPDSVATIPMNKSDADNVAGWQAVEDADTGEVVQYRFAFTDISAKEMMDGITAVVYYKNGENVVQASKTYTESVWTYAEKAYEKYGADQPALATALADMLNYGAACQSVFEYDAGNLANANMSAEWRGKATTAVPSLTATERQKGSYFYGSTFSAKNALMYTFYFNFVDGNGAAVAIPETAYAVVTYYDPSGTAENPKPVEIEVPYAKWSHETATSHGVDVTIPIAWGRTKIECVIHDGNGNVISTGNSDSIVAYTNRIQQTTESKKAQRAAMLDLLRFVDSANTYFNTKKV